VLLRHDRVVAAAVVGIPDPEWGETVAAAVVVENGSGTTDTGATAEELTTWVRDHLGSFKAPVRVELLDELPTTATGKVLRRTVRDRFSGA
jgi:fatty-acyl-CoA synthase